MLAYSEIIRQLSISIVIMKVSTWSTGKANGPRVEPRWVQYHSIEICVHEREGVTCVPFPGSLATRLSLSLSLSVSVVYAGER